MLRTALIAFVCAIALPAADAPSAWPGHQAVFQYAATRPAANGTCKVGKDQTIAEIAWNQLGSPDLAKRLLEANPGVDGAALKEGQELVVPRTFTAYLWVPPAAQRIRGVVIGGNVVSEPAIAMHPAIRAACASRDLAIVLCTPHSGPFFSAGDWPMLQGTLDELAKLSGRPELARAPLLPYGHSVGTLFTRGVLFTKPGRCFGGVFFKGGFSVPDGNKVSDLDGIPLMHIQGRFEEHGGGPNGNLRPEIGEDRSTGGRSAMQQLAALRAEHPRFLMSLFVEDGATHFQLSNRVAERMAGFIAEAAAKRIPEWPADATEPPALVAVDPASGGLSAAGDLFAAPAAPAATHAAYTGDRAATFWHGSAELATAADAFHAVAFGKRPQFVSFADDKGRPIEVMHDMRMKLSPAWSGPDTFRLRGAFWDSVPRLYPAVEGAVGHADGPVLLRIFGGALEQVDAETFRVVHDLRAPNAFVVAYHPGDTTYRYCEQPGAIRVPARLKDGKPQLITFADPGPLRRSQLPVALTATSDSDLPVRCSVDSGPARVVDGRLELSEVPATAVWPLRIEVVAWQYGSAVAPKVASAPAVRRIVLVSKD